MKKSIGYIGLMVFAVIGCASNFAPKSGEPTASIRFTEFTNDMVNLRVFDAESCGRHKTITYIRKQIGDPFIKSKISIGMLGTPDLAATDFFEAKIPAGRPLLLYVFTFTPAAQYSPGYSCDASFSLQPIDGAQYELTYLLNKDHSCAANVFRLERMPSGAVERVVEASARAVNVSGWSLCEQP